MEPYLLFSLIYFKMVRLFRVDSLSVRFVGNSLSLEILLAIENFQYTVTNTYSLSEFEINQIKWDRILWSGKFELGGSRDNKSGTWHVSIMFLILMVNQKNCSTGFVLD